MLFKKKTGIKRFTSSIQHSLDGLVDAFRTEEAFRQLLLICVVLMITACFLGTTKTERLWLISSCFLLLIVEIINTAIETVVDRISPERHALSKRAKDLGGAAQLVAVVMAITIWLVILL